MSGFGNDQKWGDDPSGVTLRINPLPELADVKRRAWTVKDIPLSTCPTTDVGGRIVSVPLTGPARIADLSLHELLHVRHSPPAQSIRRAMRIFGAPTILAAEDCRIHAISALSVRDLTGLIADDVKATERELLEAIRSRSLSRVAITLLKLASVLTIGTRREATGHFCQAAPGVAQQVSALINKLQSRPPASLGLTDLDKEVIGLIAQAWNRIFIAVEAITGTCAPSDRDSWYRFRRTLYLARQWRDALRELSDGVGAANERARERAEGKAPGKGKDGKEKDGEPRGEVTERVPAERSEKLPPITDKETDALTASGEMKIVRPPLPEIIPSTLIGRRTRASDSIGPMRRPDRARIDGAIFRRKARGNGGVTILVDNSGSMAIKAPELIALLRAAGDATVAIYSGRGGRGELRIIADKRRSVSLRTDRPDPAFKSMGGNEVDYPATRWLAEQRGRRVFITDGGFTGSGDEGYAQINREIEVLVKSRRIERFNNVETFIQEGGNNAIKR